MLQLTKDIFLGHDILLLMLLDDIFFLQDLHRVNLLILQTAHQQNFCIGSFAYYGQCFIVFDSSSFHLKIYNIFMMDVVKISSKVTHLYELDYYVCYFFTSYPELNMKSNQLNELTNNFIKQVNLPIYNKLMLQPKEIDKVIQILNSKEQSLEDIEEIFLSTFKESLSVFQASYAMDHMINHNVSLLVHQLLTLQQRIITIFLLIQNFNTEGIKKNPFGASILHISQNTYEGFQRRMISDLILEGKRQKYSKLKLEELFDDEQHMIELTPERPEIIKLRQQLISQLPKISQTRSSQQFNTIPNLDQRRKQIQPPEQFTRHMYKGDHDFHLGLMRPIPNFIKIDPFEMNWLQTGVIADVHWDNSIDLQKKFAKYKGYVKKGLQGKLSKEESVEIQRCLQNQAYAVLNLDLTPQNIILFIRNNPNVAASFLTKLGNYPVAGQYLESLLDSNINLNCIDAMLRLIKSSKVPVPLIQAFALKYLKQIQLLEQNFKDRAKMVRVTCNFVLCLMKNKMVSIAQLQQTIIEFANHFKQIEQAELLEKFVASLK